jgi:hypothetical protein
MLRGFWPACDGSLKRIQRISPGKHRQPIQPELAKSSPELSIIVGFGNADSIENLCTETTGTTRRHQPGSSVPHENRSRGVPFLLPEEAQCALPAPLDNVNCDAQRLHFRAW